MYLILFPNKAVTLVYMYDDRVVYYQYGLLNCSNTISFRSTLFVITAVADIVRQ